MKQYICEPCNFVTKIKTHYERHKKTNKHRVVCENIEKTFLYYGLKMTKTTNDHKMTTNKNGHFGHFDQKIDENCEKIEKNSDFSEKNGIFEEKKKKIFFLKKKKKKSFF